jgi:hypothetical protein
MSLSNFEQHNLNNDDLTILRNKLNAIEIEKNSLVIQAIKTSTKLMTKINNTVMALNTPHDILMKIKLLLRITRIVIDNTKEILTQGGQKADFFQM